MKTYSNIQQIRNEVESKINTHNYPSGILEIIDRAINEASQEEINDFVKEVNENEKMFENNEVLWHWSENLITDPSDFFKCFEGFEF